MEYRSRVIRIVAVSMLAAGLFPGGATSVRGADGEAPFYDSRIAELATENKFPDMSAVVLIDRRIHKWSFQETEIERSFAVKILTREGIDLYGDFISDFYNKKVHDYSVEAVVVSPGGERSKIASDYFKKAEFGRNEFQYRAALPGLEVGAIIEIHEKIKTKYAVTSDRWNFACRVPTLRSELVFMVPSGALVFFNFTPKDSKLSPVTETENKFDKHTITMEIVPPYTDEPYMPLQNIGNPTVYYHIWQITMEDYLRFYKIEYDNRFIEWMKENEIPWEMPLVTKSWNKIAEAFGDYFDPETWKDDDMADEYRAELSAIIEEMPDVDASDIEPALDRILADFHGKFQAIAYRFFYRNPEEILDHREGNPFELVYVLKRILEERDLKPSIVLASDAAFGLLDERNPDPFRLRRPLLVISENENQYWIDPFSPECGVNQLRWEYQGVRALGLTVSKDYAFITTPIGAASANSIARGDEIEVDMSGGITGRSEIIITGQELLNVRREKTIWEADDEEDVPPLIAQLFPDDAGIDNITIDRDTKDSLIVSCSYSIDNLGAMSGDFMPLDFSEWFYNPLQSAFESDKRKYEITFPFPMTSRVILSIAAPRGWALVDDAQNVKHEDEWFAYTRSYDQNENRIVFERAFAITSPKVDAQDYEQAKQAVVKIGKADKEPVILKRGS